MTRRQIRCELRIFCHAVFDWRSCLMSKIALMFCLAYLFVPIDLIPDRLPVLGHLDEVGFIALGFVGSRHFAPADVVAQVLAEPMAAGPSDWQCFCFRVRILRADLANFFLLQYRQVDGFLITGKNSGTHWLKFMLSCAIAAECNVPPPSRSSGPDADRVIGHPRGPRPANTPWIGSSHTIPSIVFASWLTRLLPHPPVVVLVREIEDAMRSNYVKWREHHGASTGDYMHGDPSGRRYVADLWWYMHFFNRWGDVVRRQPSNVLVVRYEDLQVAPETTLRLIAAHYGIALGEQAIAAALKHVGRDAIRSRLDPADTERVVPSQDIRDTVEFSPADVAFMHAAMKRHLRSDFGYGYRLRA